MSTMDAFLAIADLQATAQHIEILNRKIERLSRARAEAWDQVLTAVARRLAAGDMEETDLIPLYEAMRASYGPNFTLAWDRALPIRANRLRHCWRGAPNGPNGSWHGPVQLAGDAPAPRRGKAVVYVLFTGSQPMYVGSTDQFRTRLAAHRKEKSGITSWVAYPCRDREHAYQLEEQLLEEHRLRMNRRSGR